ncbi:hypothetical protein TNIN_429031 [Trichonephila inaurata madagascariensis]|uniref:Uncharacterized protein n=1 Tax=Trichonephila inaurata madagascariensis TaxID=2747483 RepID=A0A8X7CFB3_9ARAC|nr:hypothetical protein TNIN_429031 [Trichonephila inaurata madagascariensis]
MDVPERFSGVATVNSSTAGSIMKEVQPDCEGECLRKWQSLPHRRGSWSTFALSVVMKILNMESSGYSSSASSITLVNF